MSAHQEGRFKAFLSSSSFRVTMILAYVLMSPWIIDAPIPLLFFLIPPLSLFYVTPIPYCYIASLILILCAFYYIADGDADALAKYPFLVVYAHGLFASAYALTLEAYLGSFFLTVGFNHKPLRYPVYLYFVLFVAYAWFAYRSLSRLILTSEPSEAAEGWWKAAGLVALLTGSAMALFILVGLHGHVRLFTRMIQLKTIFDSGPPLHFNPLVASLMTAYYVVLAVLLIIIGLDEFLLGGRLRHVRYPILVPLVAHSLWVLHFLPPTMPDLLTDLLVWLHLIFAFAFEPIPGFKCMFQLFLPTFELFNPLVLPIGLWIAFEWLAFRRLVYDLVGFKGVLAMIRESRKRAEAELAELREKGISIWRI